MKTTIAILLGLALVGSTQIASAQGAGRRGLSAQPRYGAQQFPPPIATVFDINSDGVLSTDERNAASDQLLKLDTNQDGQLTADEVCLGLGRGGQQCPFGQGQGLGRGRGAAAKEGTGTSVIIALFDADKDGALSAAEIANAPQVLSALDKDQDRQLTPTEIRPLPGCGGGMGCCGGGMGRGNRWGRR